ncbi:MAG: RICIN domain-containing protein, partial [Defluviitaleaceae bacterium]|nr:RICIN domain-containing protein [Defluviitaleaceae bacterium]
TGITRGMNVTANTGHATRIGRITISLGWQEVFIDVRQAGSTWRPLPSGGSVFIHTGSNNSSWRFDNPQAAQWLTVTNISNGLHIIADPHFMMGIPYGFAGYYQDQYQYQSQHQDQDNRQGEEQRRGQYQGEEQYQHQHGLSNYITPFSGALRSAIVLVDANGGGNLEVRVEQESVVQTLVRGPRVIQDFGFNGYVDVQGHATSPIVERVSNRIVRRPVWYFVHIGGDTFAIRNNDTGLYLTETNRTLWHQARISGSGTNYNDRQRWRLIEQPGGSFRIRSVSDPSRYITEATVPYLTLSTLNTSHNRQLWWVGYIWHSIDRYGNPSERVGFWDGVVNVYTRQLGIITVRNFSADMQYARRVWGDALGITFNSAPSTSAGRQTANISVYGGTRNDIQRRTGLSYYYFENDYRGFARLPRTTDPGGVRVGAIQASGIMRNVYRFYGVGDEAVIVAIFPGSAFDSDAMFRSTAIHELGHALGYLGHSPNRNDVMRDDTGFSPNTNLNPAEIEHLRQIYRSFRN